MCPLDDTQEVSTTRSHQSTSQPDQSLTVKWGVVSRGVVVVVAAAASCCGVSLISSGFKGINFHACRFIYSLFFSYFFFLSLSCSPPKVHKDSHRPDRSVRGCGIVCVPSLWKPQASRLLEQEGQEGQFPAYRGGCHCSQWLTSLYKIS